jgi:hypothetical protein
MPLVNFSNLNFDQIKTSIRDYLKSNSKFTDYDFEGSNLSTIIDTLAYNTYITSYNANMVSNEVFIDSATLRENVVSLARNIGYLPHSKKSAVSNISFSVDVSSTSAVTLTLKSGIVALSYRTFGNESYIFSIPSDITVNVNSNGVATFNNIKIYEGTYISQDFTVSSRNPNQKYILTNSGIDTSTIRVIVRDSQSSTIERKYTLSNSLVQVGPTSPIFFIQEIPDERYELLFGDGTFGLKLQEPNYVTVNYISGNGELGNDISSFTFAGSLRDNNGGVVTKGVSSLSTYETSYGGKSIEDVNSIKKYASQIYASQNRAVTASDYEAIIPSIYPECESVSAYGGEDLEPPQYGKVYVSIKPENGVYLSSTIKENIQRDLKRYSVAGIVSEVVDLKYLYIDTQTTAYYNTNLALSHNYVKDIILNNIVDYADSTELNRFGARFKYSKFLKVIDDSHSSITSNITTVNMRRDLRPALNIFAEYEICYGNRFHVGSEDGYNIKSSGFAVSGISGTVYLGDLPNKDLLTGSVFLFKLDALAEPVIVKKNIGIINYKKGEIKMNPMKVLSTVVNRGAPLIEISTIPYSNDVIGLQDLYLQLDTRFSTVTMKSDNIASGDDISGSNYNVTSSYSNGTFTR